MSQPIIVPKGQSIYILNRCYKAGDAIPAALAKFAPKSWGKQSVQSEGSGDKPK